MMETPESLRQLSSHDFAALGLDAVAYVRADPAAEADQRYVICAADGSEIARARNYDMALATARDYDLEPVSAH